MPVIDCTYRNFLIYPGDIVIDTDWRVGEKPRFADGVKAHAGLVLERSPRCSSNPVLVAHVGEKDFRTEDWNQPGTPKIHMIARCLDFTDIVGRLTIERLLARVDEIVTMVESGEANVSWRGVDRGYEYQHFPNINLLTTCIGFVHWCYSNTGYDLIERSTIPESKFHLGSCCKKTEKEKKQDLEDWGSEPVYRYFTAFVLHAIKSQTIEYPITPPFTTGKESRDMLYASFMRSELVKERECIKEQHI